MRISDWSSDVCSSDLGEAIGLARRALDDHAIAALVGDDRRGGAAVARVDRGGEAVEAVVGRVDRDGVIGAADAQRHRALADRRFAVGDDGRIGRSEEHTSELQSLMRTSYAVFCLKKK